jgi:hypothetical protein
MEVVFHFQKKFRLSSYLSLTPPLQFCSFPAISLLVRVGGRALLDIAKLELKSASLVELGLGLSLAINYYI